MRRLIALVVLLLAAAAPAQADTRTTILKDCTDGQLQGEYTREQIRDALKNIPSDTAAYTDCVDVLKRAELGDEDTGDTFGQTPATGSDFAPGEPTPTPTPPSVPETDADREAIDRSGEVARQPVEIDEEQVLAGVSPLRDGQAGNALPGALVVALVLLGVAGLALAAGPLLRARRRRL